jgi:hypothetical protein
MPEIITREEARAKGLKRYFTGKVCPKGHVGERYVRDARCVECSYIAAAAWRSTPEGRAYHAAYGAAHCQRPGKFIHSARAAAKAQGQTRYFTGEPCSRGHIAERRVSNATCVECRKAHERKRRSRKLARRRNGGRDSGMLRTRTPNN